MVVFGFLGWAPPESGFNRNILHLCDFRTCSDWRLTPIWKRNASPPRSQLLTGGSVSVPKVETTPETGTALIQAQDVATMSSPPVAPWIFSQVASDEQVMIQFSPTRRVRGPSAWSWRAAAPVWTSSGS